MDFRSQLQATLGDAYTLERELGGGGMSRVFVATERALGRKVVIKVLPSEVAGALSVERFKREIALAARLQQANIVPMLSAGDMHGLPYFTMPYVEGESLRARLESGGELPITDAVGILKEVARALAYAHEQGVVHRDIKPDNVLLSGGTAMVTDFGVAKAVSAATTEGGHSVTATGVAVGTPAYMSPEQATADPHVDHRADIYAFGCLAYELLTGTPPFAGRPPQAMLAAHATESPTPIDRRRAAVPRPLAALVMRCLEKRPADRPQSASELVQALIGVVSDPNANARLSSTSRGRRRNMIVAAVVVVALAGIVVLRNRPSGRQVHTIAVIPRVVANADTSQDYFSDGISDELTTALAQVPGLAVISRSSAYQFKGKVIDARDVATKLQVDHIVELSVRRTGADVRVDADLVNCANGVVVWSHGYKGTVQNVRGLQDEIVAAIVAKLQIMTGGAALRSVRHTPNPSAHDEYLRGTYVLNQPPGPHTFDAALEHFQRAIILDGAFADPYAAAASVWQFRSGMDKSALEAYPKSDSLARRALALDSLNAFAHTTLGLTAAVLHWDWRLAQQELDRALSLDLNLAIAHAWYGFFAIARGDLRRALREWQESVRLDPRNPFFRYWLVWTYVARGEPDAAIAEHRGLDAVSPGYHVGESSVADAFRLKGHQDTALVLDRIIATAVGRPTSGMVVSLAALGRHAEARAAYREMVGASTRETIFPEWLARAAFAAGDRDAALTWLERATEMHSDLALWARYFPDLRPLVSDPRYQRLLERMGLPR